MTYSTDVHSNVYHLLLVHYYLCNFILQMWGKIEIGYISHWTLYIRYHQKSCIRVLEYWQNYQFHKLWVNKSVAKKLYIQFFSINYVTI